MTQQLTWSGDSALPRLSSKSVEWYTPAPYIHAVHEVLGWIDLDPASCELANKTVGAKTFYTVHLNGLFQPWYGKVFNNPPYGRTDNRSNQETWSCKLIAEYEAGNVEEAILLVNAATDTGWWAYPICFVAYRINFSSPSGDTGGPTHGSAFVYFGENVERFCEVFSQFGRVVLGEKRTASGSSLWEVA